MRIYLTTDTHFSHAKIITFGRPADYEERIYKGLTDLIPRLGLNDVVLHLGDICIGNDEMVHQELMAAIPCKRWLIKGNHDNKSNNWYLTHGWDFVGETLSIKAFGENILFSHVPQKLMRKEKNINIHGHFHDNEHRSWQYKAIYNKNRHLLLALEHYEYRPVLLEQFLSHAKKKN